MVTETIQYIVVVIIAGGIKTKDRIIRVVLKMVVMIERQMIIVVIGANAN